MRVGVMRIRLRMFGVNSLKEKRSILKRMVNDLRKKYNISISEISMNDSKVFMELGISAVSTDSTVIHNMFDGIIEYFDLYGGVEVQEVDKEIW